MLKENRTKNNYDSTLEAALPKLKVLGFGDFKSKLPEHPDPKPFSKRNAKDFQFIPDIVANRRGQKAYIEISQKTDDLNLLISKWKLLAKLAEMKDGFFGIIVPKGTIKFTQELVESHNISAKIIRI